MADAGLCRRDGYGLAWRTDGKPGGEPLLMLHALGASSAMWDPQVAAFGHRRVLRVDWPGHGASTLPPGDHAITIDSLLDDVVAVMDAVDWPEADVLGLSLGGMVGLALAARRPRRCRRLVVSNCGARIADTTILDERLRRLADEGIPAVADDVLAGWFSPSCLRERPALAARARGWLEACSAETYGRTAQAVRATDLRGDLGRIAGPVTVVSGAHDRPTPPAWQREIVAAIPGARHGEVTAAHLANLEAPEAYTAVAAGGLEPQDERPAEQATERLRP